MALSVAKPIIFRRGMMGFAKPQPILRAELRQEKAK
jgi:hypothetical protein